MMFLGFLLVATGLATGAGRLGLPGVRDWPAAMRVGMALALAFFGTDHLMTPERYLPMMPSVLPAPEALILFTGLCEIFGGIGLLVPQTRRLAGIMLAIYFVAVLPANIHNAVSGLSVEGVPSAGWYLWLRLGFQPVFIWWALRAAEVVGDSPMPRAQ